MKKILCIILSALTLIAAAGCQKAPEASPTDPAAPVENAGTPVFQLDELPEIGGFADEQQVRYFFEDGPHDTFEPREDYGGVIPYIAGYRTYSTPEFYTYTDEETGETITEESPWVDSSNYTKYGLMTADGRIITSGIWDLANGYGGKNGFGFIELSSFFNDPEEYGDQNFNTLVSADGKWMITDNDIESVMMLSDDPAYFYVEHTDRFDIYDESFNRCVSVPVVQKDEEKDGYTTTYITEADEKSFYVRYDEVYYNLFTEVDNSKYTCIQMDWTGKELWRFEAPHDFYLYGDHICIYGDENEVYLYDKNGDPLDSTGYSDVYFNKKDRLYLTVRHENGSAKIEYRDMNWAKVTPEETGWTEYLTQQLEAYDLHPLNDGCDGFSGYNESFADKIIDFYGRKIQPETEREITGLRVERDYMDTGVYLICETADGAQLLCSLDGKPLTATAQPEGASPQQIRYSSIINGYFIYQTAEKDLYLFNIETGEEERIHPKRMDTYKPADDPSRTSDNESFSAETPEICEVYNNAVILRTDSIYAEDDAYIPPVYTLCPHANAKFTEQTVLDYREFSGYIATVSATDYRVYAPDGTLLLKMRNEENL